MKRQGRPTNSATKGLVLTAHRQSLTDHRAPTTDHCSRSRCTSVPVKFCETSASHFKRLSLVPRQIGTWKLLKTGTLTTLFALVQQVFKNNFRGPFSPHLRNVSLNGAHLYDKPHTIVIQPNRILLMRPASLHPRLISEVASGDKEFKTAPGRIRTAGSKALFRLSNISDTTVSHPDTIVAPLSTTDH
jgi:hypothetical protein